MSFGWDSSNIPSVFLNGPIADATGYNVTSIDPNTRILNAYGTYFTVFSWASNTEFPVYVPVQFVVQGAGVTPSTTQPGATCYTSTFILAVYTGSAWVRAADGSTPVTF